MIHAVFFDLVGTLVSATRPIGEQYAEWARRHGAAEADPQRMGDAFRRAMKAAPPMAFPELKGVLEVAAAEREWWAKLVRAVIDECGLAATLNGRRFDAFFADLYEHFTTRKAWRMYPDAKPALEGLKTRGLEIGLITNYDNRVFRVVVAVGLSPLLDSITVPATAGAAKPAPAIFAHALRQHGVAARDAIYVGDEIGDDYEGAEAAGMRAVLIDREGRCERNGLTVIRDLRELPIDE